MFQALFHTIVTLRMSWCAPPDTGVSSLRLVAFESLRQNVLRIKIIGQYGFALDFKLSRERSKKTEAVFLVGSRRSGGKSKSPPNREFSSRFGKEEMSTEDKRRRLRRLVPPWSFLTRQRFLLEKQKKMLCRTCKFAAVHRALCSFPETPEASPMRGSCRRKATDEVGAGDPQPRKNGAALRPSRWGEGNYFFPAFAFSRLIWRRFLTASSIGWISPAACRAILVSSGPTSS